MPKQEITTAMIEHRNQTLVLISELTGVDGDAILGTSRKAQVVTARNLAIWVLCHYYGVTTTNTGVLMHKHWTSVVHAVGEINKEYRRDLQNYVEQIKIRLNGKKLK